MVESNSAETTSTDTVVGEVEAVLQDNKAPYLVVLEAVVTKAIPQVLEVLAGVETPIEIALPYVAKVWAFGGQALTDMVAGKGKEAVLADLDSTVADLIEGVRFGSSNP